MLTAGESSFTGDAGTTLFRKSWLPSGPPKAILAIVHGFGEHIDRYANVVNHFVPHGYAVCGFDLRGHGRSPGQRGHITAWRDYREDVHLFVEQLRRESPATPIVLFGHSMGALIGLDYIVHHPEGLTCAIISGAPLDPVGAAKPYLVAIARLLSRIRPSFSLSLGLETAALARDPAVTAAYQQDPLVHGKASARWGTESLAVIEAVKANPGGINIPILLTHGAADRINAASGSQAFFDRITFPDKLLRVYPGGYHESHNDLDRDQVLGDMETWIEQHL